MSKHKSEDYKLSAVKYYLNNDVSLDDVCEIFDSGLKSKERNDVSLNIGAERLTKVLEIYNKNPKLLILFSGFSNELKTQGWSESDMAKKFFLEQGVRSENLIFENKSRNGDEKHL